jgi:hypothetical protein
MAMAFLCFWCVGLNTFLSFRICSVVDPRRAPHFFIVDGGQHKKRSFRRPSSLNSQVQPASLPRSNLSLSLWFLVETAEAFSPSVLHQFRALSTARLAAAADDDEEEKENQYQDPNYPELEFVDSSILKYKVDQGVCDAFFDANSTVEQIEAMREETKK